MTTFFLRGAISKTCALSRDGVVPSSFLQPPVSVCALASLLAFSSFLACLPHFPCLRIAARCDSLNVFPARINRRISAICFAVWWTLWRFSAACCRAVSFFIFMVISVTFYRRISSACVTGAMGCLDCVRPWDAFSFDRLIERSSCRPCWCRVAPVGHHPLPCQLGRS